MCDLDANTVVFALYFQRLGMQHIYSHLQVVIPMVLLWHSSAAILSMLSSHQGVLSTKKNM